MSLLSALGQSQTLMIRAPCCWESFRNFTEGFQPCGLVKSITSGAGSMAGVDS